MFEKNVEYIPDKQSRNYGIDALRIVSMLMIVTLHVLGYVGILESSESTKYWIAWLFEIASFGAVNIYALISGYVGVYSKFRFSNLAVLWCRVAFYSISITLICKCIFFNEIGIKTILLSFFPVFSNQYWYFTAYALLFLFMPILNEGINRLSKRRLSILLLSIVTVTSIFRPIGHLLYGDVFGLGGGYSTWWLMILYLIGGYIRKYGLFQQIKKHRVVVFSIMYFVFVLATWLSKLSIQFMSIRIWGEIKYDDFLISYLSITILCSAISLLLAFEHVTLHLALARVISFLSPLAFSVYLIHEQNIVKDKLIADRFSWIAELPTYKMIPLIIGVIIGIYMLCSFIDLIRHYLFKILRIKEKLNTLEISMKQKINSRSKSLFNFNNTSNKR